MPPESGENTLFVMLPNKIEGYTAHEIYALPPRGGGGGGKSVLRGSMRMPDRTLLQRTLMPPEGGGGVHIT